MEQVKIYTPTQIAVSSIIFGPLATVFFLYKNFVELDEIEDANKTIIIGGCLLLLLLVILPFLPDNFPGVAIPIATGLMGRYVAENSQMSKDEIEESSDYDFQSNWKVLGISLLSTIVFIIMMAIVIAIFYVLGFISLH